MWGLKYPYGILLLFAHIFKASCMGTRSLTFAIDDTGSMQDDINEVKRSANRILDIVFHEKSSAIDNMVLVSINEPRSEVRAITKDRNTFRIALDALQAHDTIRNDCPEPTMQGILLALEKSHDNSYIYVFTDASAKDYPRSRQVMEMCQRKQSQINFVLTDYCDRLTDHGFKIYFDIAAACSGLAFYVGKGSLDPVLKTIEETINGNKTVMVTRTVPSRVYTHIPFTIDDQTEYAIVSVSGYVVSLSIWGPPAIQQTIMRNENVIVVKLTKVTVGEYVARVWGESSTSVIIVGRTDFLFSHGFSELVPKTLADTTPQPIAHAKVYLSILINDPKRLVNITSVHIMDMDEKRIKTMPLTETSTDFYITKPFVAPSEKFQIVVEGIVISTGNVIKRISKIPITPQKPIVVQIDKKQPVTTIVEGQKTEVDFDGTLKLTCKVSAYPEPKIKWMNSKGIALKSLSSILQVPYDYISYVTISNITKADKYVCFAANDIGRDLKTIEVVVKDAFVVKSVPKDKTGILYGSEGTITCDIQDNSGHVMIIRWYYADENKGTNGEIFSSDKYEISADGKQLKIKKMDLNLAGIYICKATYRNHRDVQKTFSTVVSAEGIVPPVATGERNTKATKGSTAVINCNVKGYPKPKISWQFEGASSKYVPLPGDDSVLSIPDVEEKHAGNYKCVAVNDIGINEHITTLTVQVPPKITTIHTEVYEGKDGDAVLKMPCDVTGIPKPAVIWKMNGATITPNSKYTIEGGALIIKDIKVEDTNSYTCEAKNDVGTTRATFKTKILQPPKVTGVIEGSARLGIIETIECTIVKGVSKPKITWQFRGESATKYEPLKETNVMKIESKSASVSVVKIWKTAEKHAGRYKCIAENELGTSEHITTLIIEFRPRIISNTSIYTGVEGDLALRIPCTTAGVPKPSIVWKINGAVVKPNDKYAMEEEALIIYSPKLSDSKSYTCEATNYLGSDSAVFKAEIDQSISFGPKTKIYIKEGENRKLECDGYNSTSQMVRWFTDDDNLKVLEPFVYLENATVSLDGNYTCRVTDKHGNTFTHTYVVDVGRQPSFRYGNNDIVDWRGDVTDVLSNCEKEGKPLADVTWYLNGKLLNDRDLFQLGDHFKWGRYSCNVSNVHGSIQRSFEVASPECYIHKNFKYSEYMPLILNNDLGWPSWSTSKKHYLMQPNEPFKVFCPHQEKVANDFQTFNKNLLQATCVKQDIFAIDGKNYTLQELQCKNKVAPNIINKKTKCLTETSELIRVGYEVKDFLGTYDVCFDHGKNVPLYARTLLTGADDPPRTPANWHKYPAIADEKLDKGITCKDTSSSCCYGRTLLVNDRNFNERPARESTFIKPLNTILYWRPCEKSMTTWEAISGMVRTQLQGFGEFVAWSGTHTLQEKGGAYIPRYLWKVLKFDEDYSLAIVHVNDPSPTDEDIKCRNICTEDEHPWFTPSNKFTYCCDLDEFLAAFNLKGHDIGE